MDEPTKLDEGRDGAGYAFQKISEIITSREALNYRYLMVFSQVSKPGMIGGYVGWIVYGTNNYTDILSRLSNENYSFHERTDEKKREERGFREINKTDFAKLVVSNMTQDEKNNLLDQILVSYLSGKIKGE